MLSIENGFEWEGFYSYAGINSTFSDLLKIFIEFDIISQNISNILFLVAARWKVTIHP